MTKNMTNKGDYIKSIILLRDLYNGFKLMRLASEQKVTSLRAAAAEVDSQLGFLLHHIPVSIEQARAAVAARVDRTNRLYLPQIAGINGGRVIRILAAQQGKTQHKPGDALIGTI